jgi:hypothetical protein
LPEAWEKSLSEMVHEHRMKWEVWIQTEESFTDLRNNLYKRGYKFLPQHSTPKIIVPNLRREIKEPKQKQKAKTMLRKKKKN